MTDVYNSKSPYHKTPLQEFYLGVYVDRPIPASHDDILIEIETKYIHRPDILSFDLYGTSKYWWIFMRRNRDTISDPIFDMVAGIEIFVPTKTRLMSLVG